MHTTRDFHTLNMKHQHGAALLVAMIIMGLIMLLATSAVRFATLDSRSAVNEELRSLAKQTAQAGVDGTLSLSGNTPVVGKEDETNCLNTANCTRAEISLPGDLTEDSFTIVVKRGNPAYVSPPRGVGTSMRAFTAAPFDIAVKYDEIDSGLGQAEIHEGLIMLVPKF